MDTISKKIQEKGLRKGFVAQKVGIDISTLSRIIKEKQTSSEALLTRIHTYLDAVNTDSIKIN